MIERRELFLLIGVSLGVGLACVYRSPDSPSPPPMSEKQNTNISFILATHDLPREQVSGMQDVWGTGLRVAVRDGCRFTTSAGPDRDFGTADDQQYASPIPEDSDQ